MSAVNSRAFLQAGMEILHLAPARSVDKRAVVYCTA